MNLPKKVKICGHTYSVSIGRKSYNSWGRTDTRKIWVGTKWKSDERKFGDYLHEVIELVCCERKVHYQASNDDIKIVMSHQEFTDVVNDVATAIMPIMEKKGKKK